jgi:hypothetical protein
MLGLLLGAGFSKWAADLPVASGLFDFAIEPFGIREAKRLELIANLHHDWQTDEPNGYAEQFIAHVLAEGNAAARNALLWYLVRRLSEPYIWFERHAGRNRRHVLMIDENRRLDRPGVRKTQQFLQRLLMVSSGIITPNYDLLIEYALGTRNFNYGHRGERLIGRGSYPVSQWRKPVSLEGSIPVAKIHGSISWDTVGRYTEGRRGITGNALIVAPTPEKAPPPALKREWDLAATILRESSRLLVFGFAFNPYDEAILNHLCDNGKAIQQVLLVDIDPKSDRVAGVWPNAKTAVAPPPPDGMGTIDAWLQAASC